MTVHTEFIPLEGEFINRVSLHGDVLHTTREWYNRKTKTFHGEGKGEKGDKTEFTLERIDSNTHLETSKVTRNGKTIFSSTIKFTRIVD